MIISSEKLENINSIMLGRGAPQERDNLGYNIPDYNRLCSIWLGANISDLYEIANRLIKYYDTQLSSMGEIDFTKDDLVETANYYKELLEKEGVKESVTVGFDTDYKKAFLGFKYNDNYINICRNHNYRFERNIKAWYGDSKLIKDILILLKDAGADVEKALEVVNKLIEDGKIAQDVENDTENNIEDDTSERDNQKTVEVIEIDEDKVALKFEYNADLVNEIKKLKNRKFDWETKSWEIFKHDIPTLYDNVHHLKDSIDLSELEEIMKDIPAPKIKVVKVQGYDVEIDFPYNEDIVSSIKELDYYSYNKKDKTWTIDLREVGILAEKIKDFIDVSELLTLDKLNYKPKVELKDYSYLERKPFAHQYVAAAFLLYNKKAILADEMGGGKSLSSLLAAYTLPAPRLIVCPASLKLNWAREIRSVDYDGIINIISDRNKSLDYNMNISTEVSITADWNIVNYDVLDKHFDILKNIAWTVIIFDEAHYMKAVSNGGKPDSIRAKCGIELGEKPEYVFLLTGTPMTNRPKDLYNLLRLTNHVLSRSFFSYAQNYCGAWHNGYGWNFNGSSNENILHEKIKPIMLRRLKKDMLDLPEKTRRFIPVEINMKEYNKAQKEYLARRKDLKNNGEHLTYLTTMKHILAKEKVKHTIEIAETIIETGESVVIFTCYDAVVKEIMKKFEGNVVKITGEDSEKTRQQAVDDFQNGKVQVIVANIIAGGVGLTLTRAINLIFNDFDWVPANHLQAEDRIHRIGQEEKVTINYVYASGIKIDEYMANLLEKKSDTISTIIDGGKGETINVVEDIINSFDEVV